jgi:hypothetical protein
MRCRIGSFLVIALLLLGTEGAFAQDTRHLELNVFFAGSGYTRNSFEIGFPQSTTPIEGRFRLDESFRGGIRFNVHNSGHWGEEFFYSFEPNEAHIIRDTPPRHQAVAGVGLRASRRYPAFHWKESFIQSRPAFG